MLSGCDVAVPYELDRAHHCRANTEVCVFRSKDYRVSMAEYTGTRWNRIQAGSLPLAAAVGPQGPYLGYIC